jgi:DNA-binding NarL/FixJ family response regulator
MPLQEIVDLALAPVLTPQEAASLPSPQAAKAKFGGLTPREREAAILIAQGKSNREIAEIMVVRVKTVETYVTRILNKLGFDSRVQIATWAFEVGLAELNTGSS